MDTSSLATDTELKRYVRDHGRALDFKFPYNPEIKATLKDVFGAWYIDGVWALPKERINSDVVDFIKEHGFVYDDAVAKELEKAPQVERDPFVITLYSRTRALIPDFAGHPKFYQIVSRRNHLPGRSFDPHTKCNTALCTQELLDFAFEFGFEVDKEVYRAVALQDSLNEAEVALEKASHAKALEDVPEQVLSMALRSLTRGPIRGRVTV